VRVSLRIILLLGLTISSLAVAAAQTSTPVEQLRSQLSDIQAKEAALQDRVKQLDEELLPENIEKYFALNGSTHPEELREQRRRQLENQKTSAQSQLSQLATSRTRLEAAISTAEAAAYRQSALPPAPDQPSSFSSSVETSTTGSSSTAQPKPNARRTQRRRARRTRKHG
jgi:cell division protein FtsB